MRSERAISTAAGRSTLPGSSVNVIAVVAAVIFLAMTAAPAHAQAGDCCWANGSPGCDDSDCEMQICAFDPFCCDVEWDSICGCAANNQCENCDAVSGGCGPGPDSCCEPKDKPGCEHPDCEALICSSDPFCCETAWDMLCARAANDQCEACGGKPGDPDPEPGEECGDPGTGDCCDANGTPSCEDEACCSAVCAADPFCCRTEWDSLCANAAMGVSIECNCDVNGPPSQNGCCVANGSPGCDDAECEALICRQDSFCCEVGWDAICAEAANDLCEYCGGDCCTSHGTPGCDDAGCQSLVCASDSFCCSTGWDGLCANAANNLCAVCDRDDEPVEPGEQCAGDLNGDGTVGPMDLLELADAWGPCSGDCPADLNGDGFVNTEDILILLQNWGECPDDDRDDPDQPGEGDCCSANGTPGCEDAECEALICSSDPFCCDTAWDGICAEAACECGSCPDYSFNCPPFFASDCCVENFTPGCEIPDCEALICDQDPFCCETIWDSICASAANDQCEICSEVS